MMFEDRDVPYFEFKHYEVDGSVTTKVFECATWKEAHEKFWEFINGCGFVIDDNVGEAACEAAEEVHKENTKHITSRGLWYNKVTGEYIWEEDYVPGKFGTRTAWFNNKTGGQAWEEW